MTTRIRWSALLLAAAVLLMAGSASAQDWTASPDGGRLVFSLSLSNQRVAYYDFADTTDSDVLSVIQCQDVTVHFDPDEDGTNTGAEVQIYRCSEDTASANHCTKVLADTDGDGILNDVTLDGTNMRTGFQGVKAQYLYVDVTANSGSDDARVLVECH